MAIVSRHTFIRCVRARLFNRVVAVVDRPTAPLIAMAIMTGAATPMASQDMEAERRGLTASIGASLGSAGVSCVPHCAGDRRSGPTFLVRGAAHVTPQVTIAIEGNVFRQNVVTPNGTGRWSMSWTTLGFLWFPRSEEDVFVSAGIGIATNRMHITFPVVGALPMNSSTIGGTVGIGKDFRFRDNMAITAYAHYLVSGRTPGLIGRSSSGARISTDILAAGLALTVF